MIKIGKTILRAAAALLVIALGSFVIAAQSQITGTWKANTEKAKEKTVRVDGDDPDYKFEWNEGKSDIHISFSYKTEKGDSNNQGTGFTYDDIQGLGRSQVESVTRAVTFQIVREAGTIVCTGSFDNGKGSGTFVFTPSSAFRSSMSSRGFEFSDRQMFAAATLDVTVALADDLSASGFNGLETDDLFKAKIFRIDADFMREMAATGFPELDMEDLVKARIFKIDAAYIRDVVSMGFQSKSFEELVKFRIFKITPEYLRDIQAAGFTNVDAEQAVKLRIFKVTPEFIREMQGEGLANLSVEQAVKLRIFKVDSEFIQKVRAGGETDLSVENLVRMKIHGKIK